MTATTTAPTRFHHVERERTIVFGPGALDAAAELLDGPYTLLTTPRAAGHPLAAGLVAGAAQRVDVPVGLVEEVATALRDRVVGTRLVALGGGRVVDVAKALAAADPPRTVTAVPTTLSGAEMTSLHRHVVGVPADTPRVRATVVLNDPAVSASAGREQLAASSGNALGHVLVAITSARTTPFAAAVAREAALRIATAWDPDRGETAPDRDAVALGALLAGWAIGESGLGLHHVLAQTAVRTAGIAHAQANVALLPATAAALRRRAPAPLATLDRLLGGDGAFTALAERLRTVAGLHAQRLGAMSVDDELLEQAVARAAARRADLERTPPAPTVDEIRSIYRAAR